MQEVILGLLIGFYAIGCLVGCRDSLRNFLDRKRVTYGDLILYVFFFPGTLVAIFSIAIAWVIIKVIAIVKIASIVLSSRGISPDAPIIAKRINKFMNSEIVPKKEDGWRR